MRIIKRLDIFILKNFMTLFAGTFCISLFVVMMQFLWKYVDELIGKGLSITVMAKFFFYAGETLVPLALPLAILLASLISFGNLGERFELLSIKAAGISLFRTIRPLVIFMLILSGASFYFQNVKVPQAHQNLMQLLYSMRQKSPELDIPEGVFYDGIEGLNLYVKNKDKESGMLYNMVIYNMRDGIDNAHIILADSGKLETTADKLHLELHLYNGEQFENLNSDALMTGNVPYRRETFVEKHFIFEFDSNFNMADAETFSTSASTKNMRQLFTAIDSMNVMYDSLGTAYYNDMKKGPMRVDEMSESDVKKYDKEKKQGRIEKVVLDSAFNKMPANVKLSILRDVSQKVNAQQMDTEFKSYSMESGDGQIRRHWIQIHQMVTMSLACLVFFFIGAPLGAIIRKGGLGLPVVVSVLIFIVYYIINTAGLKLAREGSIPVWLGMWISTMVLAPLGLLFTIKSNNDSAVFNMDAYVSFFKKIFGIRQQRHIARKEVIINDPDYARMTKHLDFITASCRDYTKRHNLKRFPSYIRLFFKIDQDEEIERISDELEYIVKTLSNSKDKSILISLNYLPILDTHAHTAPFKNRKLNKAAGIIFPIGLILLFRVGRFRLRLRKDLRKINSICTKLRERTNELAGESNLASTGNA